MYKRQEEERLKASLADTRSQIVAMQDRLREAMGAKEALIFDSHLLVLEDPMLLEEVSRFIREDLVSAEYAFYSASEKYANALANVEDAYLSERAADLRDVTQRVLANLMGRPTCAGLADLAEPCIVVAHDLTPSDTAMMDSAKVLGFVTEVGSRTSHTAILARSLRIPAVLGLGGTIGELKSGQSVLIDGFNGFVVIEPSDQTLFEYGQLVDRLASIEESLEVIHDDAAETRDGHRIILSSNIERAADVESVLQSGATGVGLFRTEFLFINRSDLPSEEEQFAAYRHVAESLAPDPVIIRALDLGGDGESGPAGPHLEINRDSNPAREPSLATSEELPEVLSTGLTGGTLRLTAILESSRLRVIATSEHDCYGSRLLFDEPVSLPHPGGLRFGVAATSTESAALHRLHSLDIRL